MDFKVEFTARQTPQQNAIVETGFTVLAAQARSMMNTAQIPENVRFKLWGVTVEAATYLSNLVVVTVSNVTKRIRNMQDTRCHPGARIFAYLEKREQ